jgi:hypothetical protein
MTPVMVQRRIRKAQRVYRLGEIHMHFPDHINILDLHPDTPVVKDIAALRPSLVIWDTLRKCFRGSTNDDDSPSEVYGRAKILVPGATHCFVHHDKKTIVDQAELEEEELFRGSGAWIDDADTAIHLVELAKGRLRASFTKVKDCEEQAPIPLQLNIDPLLLYASGEKIPEMVEWWKTRHANGSKEDMERFLLGSFVGSPDVIKQIVYGVPSGPNQTGSSDGREDSRPVDRG